MKLLELFALPELSFVLVLVVANALLYAHRKALRRHLGLVRKD